MRENAINALLTMGIHRSIHTCCMGTTQATQVAWRESKRWNTHTHTNAQQHTEFVRLNFVQRKSFVYVEHANRIESRGDKVKATKVDDKRRGEIERHKMKWCEERKKEKKRNAKSAGRLFATHHNLSTLGSIGALQSVFEWECWGALRMYIRKVIVSLLYKMRFERKSVWPKLPFPEENRSPRHARTWLSNILTQPHYIMHTAKSYDLSVALGCVKASIRVWRLCCCRWCWYCALAAVVVVISYNVCLAYYALCIHMYLVK